MSIRQNFNKRFGKTDVLNFHSTFKQWGYVTIDKSCYPATYTSHKKEFVWSILRKLYKFIDIRFDSIHTTLHCRNCIALPLQSYTFAPFRSKLTKCHTRSTTTMKATQVTAKHKHFISLQRLNPQRSVPRLSLFYFIYSHITYLIKILLLLSTKHFLWN